MTGVALTNLTLAESRRFTRDFFRDASLEFSDEEISALRRYLAALDARFGDAYPLLVRRPWKFIKTRNDLWVGFSFTRGDCVVLSEATLSQLVANVDVTPQHLGHGERLLLHEQMHVLQRAQPARFLSLYVDVLGFRQAKVEVHPWIEERRMTNPDGVDDGWLTTRRVQDGDVEFYWMATLLLTDKAVPVMGRDFTSVAVRMAADKESYQMVLAADGHPAYRPLDGFPELTARYPIRVGYDHPNEVAAYLFTTVTHEADVPPATGLAADLLAKAKDWFETHLGSEHYENQR